MLLCDAWWPADEPLILLWIFCPGLSVAHDLHLWFLTCGVPVNLFYGSAGALADLSRLGLAALDLFHVQRLCVFVLPGLVDHAHPQVHRRDVCRCCCFGSRWSLCFLLLHKQNACFETGQTSPRS